MDLVDYGCLDLIPGLNKGSQKMPTYHQLELEALGYGPIMLKTLPKHCVLVEFVFNQVLFFIFFFLLFSMRI